MCFIIGRRRRRSKTNENGRANHDKGGHNLVFKLPNRKPKMSGVGESLANRKLQQNISKVDTNYEQSLATGKKRKR